MLYKVIWGTNGEDIQERGVRCGRGYKGSWKLKIGIGDLERLDGRMDELMDE